MMCISRCAPLDVMGDHCQGVGSRCSCLTAMDITLLFKGAMNFYSNEEKALSQKWQDFDHVLNFH